MYFDMLSIQAPASDPLWSQTKLLLKSSGSSFVDAKSGYTLTPSANVVQSSDVPYGTEKSFGVSGGLGRIIVSTSGVNFNPGASDWTIEALVKMPLNHPDGAIIVFSRAFNGSNYWIIAINNNGSVEGWANHTTCRVVSATGVVAANTWAHIAFVRSGNTATLYVNGASVGTGSAASVNLNSTNTANPAIGGYSHDTACMNNGLIYDCRVTFAARAVTMPTAPFLTQ